MWFCLDCNSPSCVCASVCVTMLFFIVCTLSYVYYCYFLSMLSVSPSSSALLLFFLLCSLFDGTKKLLVNFLMCMHVRYVFMSISLRMRLEMLIALDIKAKEPAKLLVLLAACRLPQLLWCVVWCELLFSLRSSRHLWLIDWFRFLSLSIYNLWFCARNVTELVLL